MINSFNGFSALFTPDSVYISGKAFPLGQHSTNILNLDDELLREIERHIKTFLPSVSALFSEKTDSAARSAQEKLNAVWDLIFTMPLYRDLRMDLYTSYNLFPMLFADKEKWSEVLNNDSEGHSMLTNFLDVLEYFPESLRNFRGQIMGMLEMYFDPLVRRSTDAYAMAYAHYFDGMSKMGEFFYERPFEQSFPVEVSFVPIPCREDENIPVLAEKTQFSYLSHFLYTDFYRGLIAGNIPRRCHNCGRYFLLTAGYNTCYCNNIAPGETERTCRKVGAHRKEAKVLAEKTPEQKEFRRTYNRLKQRKNRGKISVDEWNAAVARAQEILEEAERGELSDVELKERLAEL